MKPQAPRVTVLMPVHNGENYLREAIESVLAQTFRDFELLIVDDASTDSSPEIIRAYSDKRVRLLTNERNLKVAASLNRGLDEARGEYVARMDADDICLPRRLEKQVEFMDSHPQVGISGTRAKAFGAASYTIRHPVDPKTIRARLLFNTAFVHPSVIMRRRLLEEHGLRYSTLRHFEDLELWQRAAECFECGNLDKTLLLYRVTKGSAFHGADTNQQRETYKKIDRAALGRLGIDPTDEELCLHNSLRGLPADTDLDRLDRWLIKLRDINRKSHHYAAEAFEPMLADYWFVACTQGANLRGSAWERFARSPLAAASARKVRKRLYCLALSCRRTAAGAARVARVETQRTA